MSPTEATREASDLGAARYVQPRLRELSAYHLEQRECRYKLDQINQACDALEAGEILGRAIVEF